MPGPTFRFREAVRCVGGGGLIAYPTEAVWGLGCDPLNGEAVTRLLKLKGRSIDKGLILIAADIDQLVPFVRFLDGEKMDRIIRTWPGPNTWLFPAAIGLPQWLTGVHQTLAVRVTDHPLASALCRAWGMPLVSTSANRGGERPARTALKVRSRLGNGVNYLLYGALGGLDRPTPIRDAITGTLVRN